MTVLSDATTNRGSVEATCPFVGLVAYSAADEEWFFGRERDARLIADNLMAYELTVLYGPSGVGKSSLISAGVLPELARRTDHQRSLGRPGMVVVVHGAWHVDPIGGLTRSIRAAIEAQGMTLPATEETGLLLDRLRSWSRELGSRMVVILDQFEEYLLYHPNGDDPATIELADAIAEVDDGANFLISIREDAVAQLDRFEGLVPSILYNTYRVEPLDRAEARGAVVGPVQHFNELHPDAALIVEDALIDEVLERVQIGQPAIEADLGQSDDRGAVEAAQLQLVFERLWREADATGSRELTLATLERLGGAEDVIRSHLTDSLEQLDQHERAIAAKAFTQLVTPSGSKIAHSVDDLATYAGAPRQEMLDVLEKLASRELRVLRSVAGTPDHADIQRFEIFHDVLGPPIVEWTSQRAAAEALAAARAEAKRERRRRIAATILMLLLIAVMIWAVLLLLRTREQARRDESEAMAAAAMNQLEVDPAAATAMALAAYRKADTDQAERALRTAIAELDERVVFSGHTGAVVDGAFSPDGTSVVTASLDGTARIWDADSGREVTLMNEPAGPVNIAQFVSDGSAIVTTGDSGPIRLWDAATGAPIATLDSGLSSIASVLVSPDGSTIAVIGLPATVEVWDVRTGSLIQSLDHEEATSVTTAAFGEVGGQQILATGDDLGTVRVWDPLSGRELARHADVGFINTVDLAGDDGWVVIGSNYIDSFVWDWQSPETATGLDGLVQLVFPHLGPYGVEHLAVSPDGARLVVVGDRSAALWDLASVPDQLAKPADQRALFNPIELAGHADFVTDVAWSPDGELLATADQTGRIRIWDGRTGSFVNELSGHRGTVFGVEFRSDGRLLSVSDDRTARLWDTSSDTVFHGHTAWVNDFALHEDGGGDGLLVSAGADGLVVGSNAETGERLWTIQNDDAGDVLGFLQSIAVSGDGRYVAAGGLPGDVNVWDVSGEQPSFVASRSAPGTIMDLAFDPIAPRLAIGLGDGTVHVWRWQEPDAPLQSLIGHQWGVWVAYNADGSRLVTGGLEGGIRVWAADTGALLTSLAGHDGGVADVTFTADGRKIVSGGWDRAVRVTDVASGEVIELLGHEHPVMAVAVDETHNRMVSGDAGGFVGVWDIDSGELLSMRRRHALHVNAIAVSDVLEPGGHRVTRPPDDLAIYSAGDDNVVRGYWCSTCGELDDLAHLADTRIETLVPAADAVAVHVFGANVAAGTCSDDPGSEWEQLTPVDCVEPHDLEYFAAFELPDPPATPHDEGSIGTRATTACENQATALVGVWPPEVEVTIFYSTAEAWEAGSRHVQCAFQNKDGSKRQGSLLIGGSASPDS